MRKFLTSALAACAMFVAPAEAATLIVQGGILQGATGVIVQGLSYDVSFIDGTCSTLFTGCDDASDFIFTQTQAQSAGQALLDQVFIDSSAGAFDSNYQLTAGCSTNGFGYCSAIVPYGNVQIGSGTWFISYDPANFNGSGDFNYGPFSAPLTAFNTTSFPYYTFAKFTASAVPEPTTWSMMILGFGAIGCLLRLRRGRKAVPALA